MELSGVVVGYIFESDVLVVVEVPEDSTEEIEEVDAAEGKVVVAAADVVVELDVLDSAVVVS